MKLKFNVTGMTCAACSARVEKGTKAVPGVEPAGEADWEREFFAPTVAVKLVNRLTTVSMAYPISWTLSSIVFLIYFLKADWIHSFDKDLKSA